MKYFKLFLTRNVTTDASLSGLSCGHVVYSGFAKNTAALTDSAVLLALTDFLKKETNFCGCKSIQEQEMHFLSVQMELK